MSRSGYIDDYYDDWQVINVWRGAVSSSIRGKRGQAFLRELIDALDAMPKKRLVAHDLKNDEGVCALGCVGVSRGLNVDALDPDDWNGLATAFNIAAPLVREIEYENDEAGAWNDTPEKRWTRVRNWAARQIRGMGQ
jgi:hypothetical protein